ncbi:uncharacterized protein METZ01_LOCUS378848, partial [marine metagenome]
MTHGNSAKSPKALDKRFRNIAHRGASGYAPENTMAAFRLAVEMGCTEVETDTHLSADGELVLLHDATLDRTTDGTGTPSDYTLDELKQLDAGSWLTPDPESPFRWRRDYHGERLITLSELFAEFGDRLTYHVELKDRAEGIAEAVVDAVRHFGLKESVFVTDFDRSDLLRHAVSLLSGLRSALAPRQALLADSIAA